MIQMTVFSVILTLLIVVEGHVSVPQESFGQFYAVRKSM